MRIAVPTEGKRKLSNKVANTFSRTSKFTIVTIKDSKIDSVELISNPGETPERGAGPLAARILKENNVDLVLTGEMGPGAKNILDALDIEIKIVEQGKSVKEVISPYIESG
jgi:predicted Fe-Mo cluster-binding NifX family protein